MMSSAAPGGSSAWVSAPLRSPTTRPRLMGRVATSASGGKKAGVPATGFHQQDEEEFRPEDGLATGIRPGVQGGQPAETFIALDGHLDLPPHPIQGERGRGGQPVGFILVNTSEPFTNLLLGSQPLYRIPLLMGVMVGITFALSVLLEWPLYYVAFRLDRRACIANGETIDEQRYSRRRIWRATVLAQVVSYLLISGGYLTVAGTGFMRHARLAHDLSFAKNPNTAVFYQDNGTSYRIRLDGSVPVRVMDEELTTAMGNFSTL